MAGCDSPTTLQPSNVHKTNICHVMKCDGAARTKMSKLIRISGKLIVFVRCTPVRNEAMGSSNNYIYCFIYNIKLVTSSSSLQFSNFAKNVCLHRCK